MDSSDWLIAAAVAMVLAPLVGWRLRRSAPPRLPTNVDALPGCLARVLVPLGAEGHAGRVSLQGLEWAARSLDGEPIGAGALVRVVRVEGVTLIVDSEPETGG